MCTFNLGKIKKEGVLITHGMFKFQKNNASRDFSTWWYTCSHKKNHGCKAKATVRRSENTEDDGSIHVENTLLEVSTPEVYIDLMCCTCLLIFHLS